MLTRDLGFKRRRDMEVVTKHDIVSKISERTNLEYTLVKKVVQKVFDIIFSSLKEGNSIQIRNFGIFKVKKRKARIGRNPRTKETVVVPERLAVVFKPSLKMKREVH